MYVKASNNVIEVFPYYVNDLKTDNPDTSFPNDMSDEMLADWDVYPVTVSEQPSFPADQMPVMDLNPTLTSTGWVVGWTLRSLTQEELDGVIKSIRSTRDGLLENCDWTQLSDSPLSDSDKSLWHTYRAELRNVPQQSGFPVDVTWPVIP